MSKGLIIIGYQGIGKSSIAGQDGCIDLESGNFYIGAFRPDNWYIPYCKIAQSLANQGYTVLVSSHRIVVNYLSSDPLPPNVAKVVVFCPPVRWKEEWIERLQKRFDETGLDKDYRALMNAKQGYTEQIQHLLSCGLPFITPQWLDYNLLDYVCYMRQKWCGDVPEDEPGGAQLYIRDNVSGRMHKYGTNRHDSLVLEDNGSINYYNLQNGEGTIGAGYSFCFADGTDPKGDEFGDPYLDIGGVAMTGKERGDH